MVLVGVFAELISLIGRQSSWGFMLFAVAAAMPLAAGAALYLLAALRGEANR